MNKELIEKLEKAIKETLEERGFKEKETHELMNEQDECVGLTLNEAQFIIQSLTQEPSATNNKSTEEIKADFYQGLNMVRDKIQRHKTALLLMINSFEKAIELKAQEPSAVSAEDVFDKLITNDLYWCSRVWEAWSIGTMSREDFVPLNQCEEFKDSFIQAMQEYAQQTNAEAMREHAIDKEKMFDFISWLKRGMWTNLEHRADGNITQTQLWYNTHRFDACENPKSLTDLYTEYLNTLTTK